MTFIRALIVLIFCTQFALAASKPKPKTPPPPQKAEPVAEVKTPPSVQFILTAESGTLRVLDETENKYSLTLDNAAKDVMLFSANPRRSTNMTTDAFIKSWDSSDSTFRNNPPSAAIIFHTVNSAEQTIRVIELIHPQYDLLSGKVIFVVRAIDGEPMDIRAALINPIITLSASVPFPEIDQSAQKQAKKG